MNIYLKGRTYNVIYFGKKIINGKPTKEFEVCILQYDQSLWRIGIFYGDDENSALDNALKGVVFE